MSKDIKNDELLHSGISGLDNYKRTNFSVQNPSDKACNIEYMTGKKNNKGVDEK